MQQRAQGFPLPVPPCATQACSRAGYRQVPEPWLPADFHRSISEVTMAITPTGSGSERGLPPAEH